MKETNIIKLLYPVLLALQIPALIFLAVSSPVFASPATDTTPEDTNATIKERVKVAEALEELLDSMNIKPFTYETEGRPDPFMPFISEKVIQPIEVSDQEPEKLTGMRQFEPGQLVLVAIMFTESNPMAMVEDSSHKGYIIRRGTKIGKSGIVSDILPNHVIIKQLSYSMAREKKYKTVEMKLRKEGEK
jgi:type IV pilus assembly protein PilP